MAVLVVSRASVRSVVPWTADGYEIKLSGRRGEDAAAGERPGDRECLCRRMEGGKGIALSVLSRRLLPLMMRGASFVAK
jgi:hypothetical protein